MNLITKLGMIIKIHRNQLRMSQYELSDKCGLARSYISDIEHGARNMRIDNLEKIAQALHVTVSHLIILAEEK